MKTSSPVGQSPIFAPPLTVAEYAAYEANIRVLRTMARRPDCTPPVENSKPSGVPAGGADGQGVCIPSVNARQARAAYARAALFQVRYAAEDYTPVVFDCVGLDEVAAAVRNLLVDGFGPLHVVHMPRKG